MDVNKLGDYISFSIALGLMLTIIGLSVYTYMATNTVITSENLPEPTPIVESAVHSKTDTLYEEDATARLVRRIKEREPLSDSDAAVKQSIINTQVPDSDNWVVYYSDNVQVFYIVSADVFMAEIETPDIAKAKADVNVWFRNQGMSQEGICNAPVMFYLSSEMLEKLDRRDIRFNPLPNSC